MIALLFPALVAWCALCWWVGTLVAKPAWPKAEPTRSQAWRDVWRWFGLVEPE